MIKSKYYSLILLTFVWVLILFFGCAAPILDYSKLTYRAPEFQSDQLFKGGFAQLPSVARPGLAYLEEPVDNLLETKLAELGENLNAVPLEHTKENLRDPLIKDKFNSITRAYFTRTRVDGSAVSSLSRSIGEHFMLFIYIEDFGTKLAGSTTVYHPGYALPGGGYQPGYTSSAGIQQRGIILI